MANDAPLSRFSVLCKMIDSVVGTLEQDGRLTSSFRDEIQQLREVSGTLQRMEESNETETSLESARAHNRYDAVTWSGGDARHFNPFDYRHYADPEPRRAPTFSQPRYISHYPSPNIVQEGQEGDGVEGVKGVENVEEVGVAQDLEERIGRSRRTEPRRARAYPADPMIFRERERERWDLGERSRSRESKSVRAELICQVERAPLELDMRHVDWRTFNKDHIIVTYHRDVPNQFGGERLDEGARIGRQGTFSRNTKRPERIRINSEILIGELENVTSTLFREHPLVSVNENLLSMA
jgi:hypothetical protein